MNQSLPLFPLQAPDPEVPFLDAVDLVADILHVCHDQMPGTRVAVAGGAARDLAHRLAPRDIDLVLCPLNEDDEFVLLQALELDLGYKIVQEFERVSGSAFLHDVKNTSDYEALEHDNRWSRVVKLACPGKLPVDLLVSTCDSLEDAIGLFDFNINQFAVLRPFTVPRFFGESQGELIQNREASVSPERKDHIQTIARKLGWSVPA